MPIYEYKCKACEKKFETMRSMKDADAPIACWHCESRQTERLLSMFYAKSAGRSAATMGSGCGSCSANSCTSCRH